MQTASRCLSVASPVRPKQVCSAACTKGVHQSHGHWQRWVVSRPVHALLTSDTKHRRLHSRSRYVVSDHRRQIACASTDKQQAPTTSGNGSILSVVEHSSPKNNGSSVRPSLGGDDGAGRGNGSGGSGNGDGRGGDGSFSDEPDGPSKMMLMFLSIVVGAATVYGGYHLWTALEKILFKQKQTTLANQQTDTSTDSTLLHQSSQQATDSHQQRPHDDIAALKRLLREVFTTQLSFDKRVKALEPKEEDLPEPDSFKKLREYWTGPDEAPKAKIEVSGSLGVGSALLYSKGQDKDRAVRSLDQSGVSTSAQMLLNVKSDLGSLEKGSLHAQCLVDAANSHAALQKIVYEAEPRDGLRLYVAPVGGRSADAIATLNAQEGCGVSRQVQHGCVLHQQCQGGGAAVGYTQQDKTFSAAHFRQGDVLDGSSSSHTLLQVSSNPVSNFCFALVGARNSSVISELGWNANTATSSNGEGGDDGLQATTSARQGRGWASYGLRGPWRSPQPLYVGTPAAGNQTAAANPPSSSSQHSLGVTGVYQWCQELAVSGWTATGQGLRASPKHLQWGLTVSSYPEPSKDSWAVSLRRCHEDGSTGQSDSKPRFTAELALQKRMADGLVMTPGLVYSRSSGHGLASLCCRAEWQF